MRPCSSNRARDESPNFSPQAEADVRQSLVEHLQRSPRLAGLNRSRWWLDGLRQAAQLLANYTLTGIWKLLQRWGLRYKRGRTYVHSPDPLYNLKMAYLDAARAQSQGRPEHTVLLYMDEFTYMRRASVARAYAGRGAVQAKANTGYKTNTSCRIAACLNHVSGRVVAVQRRRFDRNTLLRFFRQVERSYPNAERIFIALDNWPPHFHPDIHFGLANSKITLLRLPTYAPWTNPIEKLWLRLNQQLLHLHPFVDDWPALKRSVQAWLEQWATGSLDLLRFVGLSPY